jgi:sec-independent protein translocase protein TatA
MWEVLILLFIVLLLFGAKRLPEIGGSLGKGIREFKGSLKEVEGEFREIGGSDATSEAPKTEREKQEHNSA